YKGADQLTFERFLTKDLASNPRILKKFIFLLGAERVVAEGKGNHLYELLEESRKVSKDLSKDYYVHYSNARSEIFKRLSELNPEVSADNVLLKTQKLLDRAIFCAFAEDRDLLPPNTLAKAHAHNDPYNPKPIWENFRGLFDSI